MVPHVGDILKRTGTEVTKSNERFAPRVFDFHTLSSSLKSDKYLIFCLLPKVDHCGGLQI